MYQHIIPVCLHTYIIFHYINFRNSPWLGQNGIWIGARAQPDLNWYWTDGTTWEYTNWAPREPNLSQEGCIIIKSR